MNLSLDYDNTYTRDNVFWDTLIDVAQRYGHTVHCVTMRTPAEGDEVIKYLAPRIGMTNIHFTSRKNKHDFMFAKSISIDVWIDDMPYFILNDARS